MLYVQRYVCFMDIIFILTQKMLRFPITKISLKYEFSAISFQPSILLFTSFSCSLYHRVYYFAVEHQLSIEYKLKLDLCLVKLRLSVT